MITFTKLGEYGRFGNQLFQIAATIGIAKENNHHFGFDVWEYQKYFNNQLPYLPSCKITPTAISEQSFSYNKIKVESGCYDLLGYFQSEKYFENSIKDVEHYFSLKGFKQIEICNNIIKSRRPNKEIVTIHVRLGDYLSKKDYHTCLCETNYYHQAVEEIYRKLGKENVAFALFSDDLELARSYMQSFNIPVIFIMPVRSNKIPCHIFDFGLIKKFKHHIIANSSFSWWSSYLSNPETVIAPKNWFGEKLRHHNTKDLYTNKMIVL